MLRVPRRCIVVEPRDFPPDPAPGCFGCGRAVDEPHAYSCPVAQRHRRAAFEVRIAGPLPVWMNDGRQCYVQPGTSLHAALRWLYLTSFCGGSGRT